MPTMASARDGLDHRRSVGTGSRRRWLTPGMGTFIALASLAVVLSACGGSTTIVTSGATSPSVSIPRGWKTYTYLSAAISVPNNWVVRHGTNCPDGQAPGTLLLGFPKVLENCTLIPASISYVAVTTLPSGNRYRSPPFAPTPVMVNGIPIYQGFGSPGSLVWAAPTLGVQVAGTGPDTLMILHTLRRA